MSRSICVALLAAFAAVAAAQDDPTKQAEKEAEAAAKTRLDELRAGLKKCRAPADFVEALTGLGQEPHALILAELRKWLVHAYPEVRTAAADEIGKFAKDDKAARALIAQAGNDRTTDVAVACLRNVAAIAHRGVARELVRFFRHKELGLAGESIETSGKLKSKDSIEPILALVEEFDKIDENRQQGGGGGYGGQMPGPSGYGNSTQNSSEDEKIQRKKELLPKAIPAHRNTRA